MLTYITEVILFQLGFLLVFEIFLKRETFFNYNRLYLLGTPVLAFLIPFLKLEFLVDAVPQNSGIWLPEVFIGNKSAQVTSQAATQANSALEINWWYIIYLAGFAGSFFLFLKKYQSLNRLFRFRKIAEEKDFKIIEVPNSNIACTFLNTIFLGDQLSENEKNQILSHELVHVKQKHSFDLIFFEVMKIILWFNPLIYIFQSRIAGLHEFIADDQVVKTTEKSTYYEQLLNTAFNTQNISFINQFFNHSLIKKRILMLKKHKSSQLSKFKFLLVIPLMLAMLTYVACSDDQKIEDTPEELNSENVLTVEIEDFENRTPEEKAKMRNAFDELANSEGYSAVKIIDKEKTLIYNKNAPEGTPTISVKNNNGSTNHKKWDNKEALPYAVIEKVPAFKGCEAWENDVRKNCTSGKISQFVNENFDTSLGKKLGLTGINRVIVQFRIDETGKITDVKARAPHEALEDEAKRVISSIPQMQPGEQNGRPVSVMYSLPIAFQVSK